MSAKKGKVVQDAGANDPPKGECILFAFCSATLFSKFVRTGLFKFIRFCSVSLFKFVRFCSVSLFAFVQQVCLTSLFGQGCSLFDATLL